MSDRHFVYVGFPGSGEREQRIDVGNKTVSEVFDELGLSDMQFEMLAPDKSRVLDTHEDLSRVFAPNTRIDISPHLEAGHE